MSTQLPPGNSPTAGWWAIDVAGYLLTRLDGLAGSTAPSALDADAAVDWIRHNELPWAPGTADPATEIPWSHLRSFRTDAELVEHVLTMAAGELTPNATSPSRPTDARFLAARRLIPISSLQAYGMTVIPAPPEHDADLADGHVHQGAALPFEVTLRWVASSMRSIGQPDMNRLLKDTTGCAFNPQPLLLLLRNLLEEQSSSSDLLLRLAVAACCGDAEAWSKFNNTAAREESNATEPLMMDAIRDEKEVARGSWTGQRRIARLRVEAILLGAVTQRRAGLDVFVDLFEQFSQLRRGRLPKAKYFETSIATHATQSRHRLRRLELRLGERIASAQDSTNALEREYVAALAGYRGQVRGMDRAIKVTFPLGLVKSVRRAAEDSPYWRFNPRGIYRLVEALIDMLDAHPAVQPFVDGIDVCGLEVSEPNWLFACAFERFATATSHIAPRPACRFHAGEWQWTPLHGLRRIGEFMQFALPSGTPRRLGHGLALHSSDWRRLGVQPVDELLDDLVWSYMRLQAIPCDVGTRRLVERLILDLRRMTYLLPAAQIATVDELVDAYLARYELSELERISFVERERNRLVFPDRSPTQRNDLRSQLLVAHLGKGYVWNGTVAEALDEQAFAAWTVSDLHTALLELYDLLAPEIVDDLRWGGAVVEACPTSNVLAGGVRGYVSHPMGRFIETGLLATINTDDPSVFHSWMPEELAHAEDVMAVPSRSVARSRELGLRIVAPGLEGIDVHAALDAAIKSLDTPRVH